MLKKSKFNYVCENDGGDVLIYNAFVGAKSLCKLHREEHKEKFNNGEFDENDPMCKELIKKGILVDEGVNENLKLYTQITDELAPSDLSLVISITEKCNFLCKYCYESHNNMSITPEVKEKIIEFVRHNIHKYTAFEATWFGGEPLLMFDDIKEMSKEFMKICAFNKRYYKSSITTNGYLLDVDTFKELLKLRIRTYQITIDGTEPMHNMQRPLAGGQPTFKRIYDNLMEIKKLKNHNFHIVIRSNLTEEIFNHMDEYVNMISDICGNDNRFSVSVCYASVWSDNIDPEFKDTFIYNRDKIFPLYEKLLECDKSINYSFLLDPSDGACEFGRRNCFFVRPNGELHKCSVRFEDPKNIVGKFEDNKIKLNENYYVKNVYPRTCEELENCFFAPVCKGDGCPAIRKKDAHSCPDNKGQMKYILRLLDKGDQLEAIS